MALQLQLHEAAAERSPVSKLVLHTSPGLYSVQYPRQPTHGAPKPLKLKKARSYLWSRCRIPFGASSILAITYPLQLGLGPSHKLPGASVEHACGLQCGAGQAEVMQDPVTSNDVLYLLMSYSSDGLSR